MMTKYAAIDWSMTSPALAICEAGTESEVNGRPLYLPKVVQYFGFKSLKRHKSIDGITLFERVKDYETDVDRFEQLTDAFVNEIHQRGIKVVFMEGYAYGAKGNTFTIGECTGILKYKMWKLGITFIVLQPSAIKKYATGKGNANKTLMYDSYVEQTGHDMIAALGEVRNGDKIPAPVNDLVDAYWILNCGISDHLPEILPS